MNNGEDYVVETTSRESSNRMSSIDDFNSGISPDERLQRPDAPRFQFLVQSYDGSSIEDQSTSPGSAVAVFSDIDHQSSQPSSPANQQSASPLTASGLLNVTTNGSARKPGHVIRRTRTVGKNGSAVSADDTQHDTDEKSEESKTVKAFVSGLMRAPSWTTLSTESRTLEEVTQYVFRASRTTAAMKGLRAPTPASIKIYAETFGIGLVGGSLLFLIFRVITAIYALLLFNH